MSGTSEIALLQNLTLIFSYNWSVFLSIKVFCARRDVLTGWETDEGWSGWIFHHVHLYPKAGPGLASFLSVFASKTSPEKGRLVLLFATTTLLLCFLLKSSHLKCADALWSLCFYSPWSRSGGKCLLPSLEQNFGSCLINSLVYSGMRFIATRAADLEEIELLCGVRAKEKLF